MKDRIAILIIASFQVLLLSCTGQEIRSETDWNQWRGPDRSGTWYNGPDIDTLTAQDIKHIWEFPVGPGYSGPTISHGKVFVTDYINGQERILCVEAENGKLIWEYEYESDYLMGYPTGPRASVLIDGDLIYSLGAMGHIYCLEADNGNLRWMHNAVEEYNSRIPTWGLASSPIIVGDFIIFQIGGTPNACLVAFDKHTGEESWTALEDEASYSAPVLIKQASQHVLVYWTGERICGLNPYSGDIYWTTAFEPHRMIMNIADPVYDLPYLFLSAFFDGSFLLRLDQEKLDCQLVYHRHGVSERETDALHSCISTPIVEDGYVYGVDSYGEVRCLDLLSGDRLWEALNLVPRGRWANIHFIRQGKKVWGFSETGELLLGMLSPNGYRDLGRVKVIDPVKISPNPRNGVCWAHPAFSESRIFLRSDAELVCIEIK